VLAERGVTIVGPEHGRLAGGDVGAGRLADPVDILAAIDSILGGDGSTSGGDMAGLEVLVTAGGTREPICPVRYVGNRSSGKQGHALARAAAARGAKVRCVTTQPETAPDIIGVQVLAVETAADMATAVLNNSATADIVLMAAAVADFRPVEVAGSKLKKADGTPEIMFEPTTDILAELGRNRSPGQVLVGFAAETDDLRQNATSKLESKGIDMIVANDVSASGVGFGHDTNAVLLLDRSGASIEVPLSDKHQVAAAVLDAALGCLHNARDAGGATGHGEDVNR